MADENIGQIYTGFTERIGHQHLYLFLCQMSTVEVLEEGSPVSGATWRPRSSCVGTEEEEALSASEEEALLLAAGCA